MLCSGMLQTDVDNNNVDGNDFTVKNNKDVCPKDK